MVNLGIIITRYGVIMLHPMVSDKKKSKNFNKYRGVPNTNMFIVMLRIGAVELNSHVLVVSVWKTSPTTTSTVWKNSSGCMYPGCGMNTNAIRRIKKSQYISHIFHHASIKSFPLSTTRFGKYNLVISSYFSARKSSFTCT